MKEEQEEMHEMCENETAEELADTPMTEMDDESHHRFPY